MQKLRVVTFNKERDTGAKGGDQQPSHEGGRQGNPGTHPSGTGTPGGPQDTSKSGGSSGGKK